MTQAPHARSSSRPPASRTPGKKIPPSPIEVPGGGASWVQDKKLRVWLRVMVRRASDCFEFVVGGYGPLSITLAC